MKLNHHAQKLPGEIYEEEAPVFFSTKTSAPYDLKKNDQPECVNKILYIQRLRIPSVSGFELLVVAEITHLEADGGTTHIHLTSGRRLTAGRNLGFFENVLVDKGFCRIHNRFLVNLFSIRQYHHSDRQVVLSSGLSLPVAQQRMKLFLEAVGISW